MTHRSDLPANHPLTAWRAGFVRRWHMVPEMSDLADENAAHQWRCTILAIKLLTNPSRALLFHCLTHDVAELYVGDLASTSRGYPFSEALDQAESEAMIAMGFGRGSLTPFDARRFKFVDKLDAYLFALHRRPSVLQGDFWPQSYDWLTNEWEDLIGSNHDCKSMIGERP